MGVRKWDCKTILINMAFDIERMTKEDMDSRAIVKFIKRKIAFIENPPVGNKVIMNEKED
jgi:hypothetical protein